jgi:hypothetical protein
MATYGIITLAETNRSPGVLLLNAVNLTQYFIVGKAPLMCGLTSGCSSQQRRQAYRGRFVMCPICESPILKEGNAFCSVRCRNTHNARQHKSNKTKKVCKVCGKTFYVFPSDDKRHNIAYCSNACKGKDMSQVLRNTIVELTCQQCGKTYQTRGWREKQGSKYCSRACSKEAFRATRSRLCEICKQKIMGKGTRFCSITCRSKGWLGEGNPWYKPKVQRSCENCGAGFEVIPAVAGYGQGRFCGRRCFAMWQGAQEQYSRGRGGKRPDLNNQYFRSSWEANYARYLNWLIQIGEILEWAYEPDTFEFLPIKRGQRFYTPDFRITNLDHSREYHEVKGWMDKVSKTKLSRMAKYYPEVKVIVIDSDAYRALAKDVKRLIPNWETIQ